MTSIAAALRRIKDDSEHILDAHVVEQTALQLQMQWRQRELDPVTTMRLYLLQVLHGNPACAAVPHLADQSFTPSAYCQARRRLPLDLFRQVCGRLAAGLHQTTVDAALDRFLGHRVFLADGSSCSMPDTAVLQESFGQPVAMKEGCGFPAAHLLVQFSAASGLLLDMIVSPIATHDMSKVQRTHRHLERGDLLLADRGFCSFAHLALLMEQGVHGLFRLHQRIKPGQGMCQIIKRLGANDHLVEWSKPKQKPKWRSQQAWEKLPTQLRLRQVRFRVGRPGYRTQSVTIVTTLMDPTAYPASELARLYGLRWTVEDHLRNLKVTLGMRVVRPKTVAGVLKELCVFAMVYNLVRLVMIRSAQKHGLDLSRVSFIDALRCLRHREELNPLPRLFCQPWRPGRVQPRVIKRRQNAYRIMTRPRAVLLAEILGETTIRA